MKNTKFAVQVLEFNSSVIQSQLNTVEQLVTRFRRMLDDEAALMNVRNAGDLPALVVRKNAAIADLMQNENFMIHLFSDHAEEPAVAVLRQNLEECRNLNRLNQSVASLELNATRKSLELLRSLQRMDDLPLYGSAGKINVVREKRDLGEA
ncbi:hypothetical protein [Granulosicoccus antarcticus]|uniref:FlgN protein n=1 Tax=Granulosicoccus antarcticus IMCC3135 TaxID=1192854 RepID=A0A2Z2NKZ5_9GAMM|nr:hypothetical protein [Granulosicoccus antarcticus]ASJ71813.1 hypothetical protein IMCC3135_08570 [Granulosicoccus antarcticus IMCC3135]